MEGRFSSREISQPPTERERERGERGPINKSARRRFLSGWAGGRFRRLISKNALFFSRNPLWVHPSPRSGLLFGPPLKSFWESVVPEAEKFRFFSFCSSLPDSWAQKRGNNTSAKKRKKVN